MMNTAEGGSAAAGQSQGKNAQINEANTEDLKQLFKLLQSDGKVTIGEMDRLNKKIDKLGEEANKDDNYKDQKDGGNSPTPNKGITLTHFPNNSTVLSYEGFVETYNEANKAMQLDDSLLTQIFSMFDYNKDGLIDVVDIKQMLEVFGFRINSQDVRNVLRQQGVGDSAINEKDFRAFFKKILNEE